MLDVETKPPEAEAIGPYLRRRGDLIAYWCVGCDHAHMLNVCVEDRGDGLPAWEFNGDPDAPTFHPSIAVSWPANQDRGAVMRCHSFVRGGVIEYLGDSAGHELRGLHRMVPFPSGYGGWS